MKKHNLAIAMLMAVSSQMMGQAKSAVTPHKFLDNWYIGVNIGATTPQAGNNGFKLYTPTEGIRIGKNFTSVFGVVADLEMYTNLRSNETSDTKCFVDATNLSLLASCNLSNAIGRYTGTPRLFEFYMLGGLGWGHPFGVYANKNYVTGKIAVDAAWNFGTDKEFQLYFEPAVTWAFEGYSHAQHKTTTLGYDWAFDCHHAQWCLKVGFNYKFKCSNGHHNFTLDHVTTQEEVDMINSTINSLRAEIASDKQALKDADDKIAQLERQLQECKGGQSNQGRRIVTNLQPVIAFEFNSARVEKAEDANVLKVAAYMMNNPQSHVTVYGYTSPEGPKEVNDRLSQQRADVVRDLLIYKYGISKDRLKAIGLGVYDKLAVEPAAKRVVVFTDTTK